MPTVAIVGASPKPERYAFQALQRYRARGWTVWPVHPEHRLIGNCPVFPALSALPGRPDIICLYVNPSLGLAMLDDLVAARPRLLWLNPGADSDELVAAVRQRGLYVIQACTLVVLAQEGGVERQLSLAGPDTDK